MFAPRIVMTAIAAVAILLAIVWYTLRDTSPVDHSVRLSLSAQVDGAPLVFDQYDFQNPGGDGEFKIRNFRFFLSNVKLHHEDQEYAETDSYHLVRFDDPDAPFVIQLDNVPFRTVDRVTFSIGVDEPANKSIQARGDLDPNSRMAWNWEVGYKFVVLEGSLKLDDQVLPLVYHVGFSENRREIEFQLMAKTDRNGVTDLTFSVDAMKLFDGSTIVDMSALDTVKFDKIDAATLADNYKHMVALTGN